METTEKIAPNLWITVCDEDLAASAVVMPDDKGPLFGTEKYIPVSKIETLFDLIETAPDDPSMCLAFVVAHLQNLIEGQ